MGNNEIERFNKLVDEMKELHAKKNTMYGSSFEKLIREEGSLAGLIPLKNKIHRIETVRKQLEQELDPSTRDELNGALEDSLIDLGTYAYKWASWERKSSIIQEAFIDAAQITGTPHPYKQNTPSE